MRISEIQRSSPGLKPDAALRAEVEPPGAAQTRSPEDVVASAAAKSYDFNANELAEVATEAQLPLRS